MHPNKHMVDRNILNNIQCISECDVALVNVGVEIGIQTRRTIQTFRYSEKYLFFSVKHS